MRYKKLDLNLLIALDALLSTRSVSKAAAQVHVSQPAMSASLGRLREFFEDALLTPSGRAMALTPLALSLIESTRRTMESIDETTSHRSGFDPAQARRTFVVAASDYSSFVILQPTMALLAREAPGITLEIIPTSPQITQEQLKRREIDFAILPEELLVPDHPWEPVLQEELCCAVWTGNTQIKGRLSARQYLQAGHVVTRYGLDRRAGYMQATLERFGLPAAEVTCGSPLLLCPMVVGTNRIATVMKRLAVAQAAHLPIRLLTPPIQFPALNVTLQWHRARDADGGMVWFRQAVARALNPP